MGELVPSAKRGQKSGKSSQANKNQADGASYHPQRIFVGKFDVASFAVMLVMSLTFHVLVRCTCGVEFGAACFAWYLG
jgi:hypothetical protein